MQIVIDIDEDVYKRSLVYKDEQLAGNSANDLAELTIAVANGTPLPDGAEILTKEAYSDLCMRAAEQPEKRTEKRTKTHACDCISRQAAKSKAVYSYERHEKVVPVAELDWLPSVEPERKVGKWIVKIEDWNRWTCSECGFSKRTDIHVSLGYKFCPNCGAKMEVDG